MNSKHETSPRGNLNRLITIGVIIYSDDILIKLHIGKILLNKNIYPHIDLQHNKECNPNNNQNQR